MECRRKSELNGENSGNEEGAAGENIGKNDGSEINPARGTAINASSYLARGCGLARLMRRLGANSESIMEAVVFVREGASNARGFRMGAAAEGVTFGGDTERSRGVSTGEDVGPPSLAELEMRLTPGCSIPRVVRRDDFPIAISGTIGLTGAEIIVDAAVFAAVGLTEAEIIVDAAVCAAVGLTEAEIIVDAAVCAGSTVLSTDFFALVVFAETRGSVSVAGAFTLLDSSESTIEAHGAIQVDDDNVGAEVVSSTSLL